MDSEKSGEATLVKIQEPKPDSKGKGIAGAGAPAPVVVAAKPRGGWRRGIAITDLVVRLCAIATALAAASLMATTEQILPFFTQFFQFHAQYNDLPTFTFFLFTNGIAGGYLILSLPFSIICIVRPLARAPRLLLIVFDTVVAALTIAGASASATIVYLAHNGSSNTNWNAICQQYNDYCQQSSTAVVNSFVTAAMFTFLNVISAFALRRK